MVNCEESLSIRCQCKLLSVSRGSFYYKPLGESEEKGFLYMTAIIDVYSRYVVGWGISNTLDAACSLNVTGEAIARHGKPEIINLDQDSQFTCHEWIEFFEKEGIRISMPVCRSGRDGKGRAIDNIFIERF